MVEQEKQQEKIEEVKKETKPVETIKNKETETKSVEKKETKKEKPTEKKNAKIEAVVNAKNLPISTKHAIAICNMIRNKDINKALEKLELAHKKKIPVPMKGEIPHKKGIMSGRYPIKALGYFIKVIKSLKANALVNELELEKYKIFCKANVASRPYKRFGKGRFKRTHVQVKLLPITKIKQ